MKKVFRNLFCFITAVTLICCLSASAGAAAQNSAETVDYLARDRSVFELQEYTDSHYEITKYTGSEKKLKIRSSEDSYPTYDDWLDMIITISKYYDTIADSAFENSDVVEVVLADYWHKIGDHAFRNCKQLRKVTIPSSVDEIGIGVFDGCNLNLLTVTVAPYSCAEKYCRENKIKYEYEYSGYYLNCWEYGSHGERLERDTIEDYYFARTNLEEVILRNEGNNTFVWRKIGRYAFQNCRKLRSITIPSTVETIGAGVFSGCNLQQLTVTVDRDSVAERYCINNGIRYVYPPEKIGDGQTYQWTYRPTAEGTAELLGFAVSTRGWYAAGGSGGPYPELIIPVMLNNRPLVKICEGAFTEVGHYYSLILPATMTEIEDGAFVRWPSLQKICIPATVKKIGAHAFDQAEADSLVIKVIRGSEAEKYCKAHPGLKWDYWSDEDDFWYKTRKDDGTVAVMQYNGNKKELTIPRAIGGKGVTSVGKEDELNQMVYSDDFDFTGNDTVETIIIPDTVTKIVGAIKGFGKLKKVIIPSSVAYISEEAFQNLSKKVVFAVSSGSYAEKYCKEKGLKTQIVSGEKESSSGTVSLTIEKDPQSVTQKIGEDAVFEVRATGEGLTFQWETKGPNSTMWANSSLQGNKTYKLTVNVTKGTGSGTQYRCVVKDSAGHTKTSQVATLTVREAQNSNNQSDMVASGTCGTRLKWTLDKRGALIISGSGKMDDYEEGKQPWHAYKSSIKSVVIQSGVTSVGNNAFCFFQKLTKAELPETVTEIGKGAFFESGLQAVTIPASVKYIGFDAFLSCQKMTSITVTKNNPNYSSENGILYNKTKTNLIVCPAGKKTDVTVSSNTTEIEDYAFENCKYIKKVVLSPKMKRISLGAFWNCESLTRISIPVSLREIDDSAFGWCIQLTDVDYAGTAAQWKKISIHESNNSDLEKAKIHYQVK